MWCEPFRVITMAFRPLGVASLEREGSQFTREMRGWVGNDQLWLSAGWTLARASYSARASSICARCSMVHFRRGAVAS